MALVVVGALISFVLAVVWRNSPWRLVAVALVLWILVPAAEIGRLSHRDLAQTTFVHPASVVLIAGALVQVLLRRRASTLAAGARIALNFIFVALGLSLMECILSNAGLALWSNQWFAPICAFYLVGVCAQLEPKSLIRIGKAAVLSASASALVGVVGSLNGSTSPYSRAMDATYYWFSADTAITRQSSTTDAPLTLAFVCAICVPLFPVFRNVAVQVLTVALLFLGTILAEGRAGVLVCAVAVVYLVVRGRSRIRIRVSVALVCLLCLWASIRFNLLAGLELRVHDDNGSAGARAVAWSTFFDNLTHIGPFGYGPGSSATVAANLGLRTSFESAFVLYALSFGLLISLMLFVGMFVLWASSLRLNRMPGLEGAPFAALAALVLIETSSSVSTQSAIGLTLWVIIGLAVYGVVLPRRGGSLRVNNSELPRETVAPGMAPAGSGADALYTSTGP